MVSPAVIIETIAMSVMLSIISPFLYSCVRPGLDRPAAGPFARSFFPPAFSPDARALLILEAARVGMDIIRGRGCNIYCQQEY